VQFCQVRASVYLHWLSLQAKNCGTAVALKLHQLRVNSESKPYDNHLMLLDLRGGAFILSETKYRRDIQVFRGLVVLAIVLFHAKKSYFPLGYLGVDVFFVISGFVVIPLILRIFTDQGKKKGGGRLLFNLRYFYKRRFYRLAPALAVTLAISAISIFLLGPISDHQRFARQGIATLLLVGNFGADRYSGDYFSSNPNPLVHTWSLSVEEQIYIFLPLILIIIIRNRKSHKKITAMVLGFISALSFVSFLFPTILLPLYSRAGIELSSQFWFYSPIDRIWQFTAGGLAFLLLDRYQNHIRNIPKGIHLLAVISVVMILFGPSHMNLKVSSILASLFALFIILFRSFDVLPDFLMKKLEWVGDRSYSIYLAHMPLLYLAKYSPVTQIGNGENRIVQSVIAVVVSVLLGALSYSKIENRFRGGSKSNAIGFKTISAAMVLTLAIPLVLFISMDIGKKAQYWGLDRNIQQPPHAGNLDTKCARISETGPPCVYNTTGATNTVLLIGDSHASHISQAIVDASQSTKWNAVVWTTPGCHIQFQRSIPEQVSDNCIYRNNLMKKWVEENRPYAIIVSQFVHSDSSQNDLRNALSTLRSIVPNILLIENNPIFPDEKNFMRQRPIVMPAYKPPKSFQQSMMQTVDKNASDLLANWAERNGVFTMSFDSLFCEKGVCSRYSNKGWLYRDDDHFSVVGAELTIPQISAFLKQF
jgi:peptidoglycan/LPS O-acetylase OafA/YrhL